MARIAGVDLPNNKQGEIGLTYIFGIGRSSAKRILEKCGIDPTIKVGDWNDDQIAKIRVFAALGGGPKRRFDARMDSGRGKNHP